MHGLIENIKEQEPNQWAWNEGEAKNRTRHINNIKSLAKTREDRKKSTTLVFRTITGIHINIHPQKGAALSAFMTDDSYDT